MDLGKCQNICYEVPGKLSRDEQVASNQALLAHLREVAERVGIAIDFPQIVPTESSEVLSLGIKSYPAGRPVRNGPKDYVAILPNTPAKEGYGHLPLGS